MLTQCKTDPTFSSVTMRSVWKLRALSLLLVGVWG